MLSKFLIAIDSGKSYNKAVFREHELIHKVKFQTKMEEVFDSGAEVTPGTFDIQFEDKNYMVGDMLDESKMDFNLSKKSDTHRICIYNAIAQLLQKSSKSTVLANVSLAINIPLALYKNEKQKQEFADFIQCNRETICIIVNKKSFLFKIENILLLPEGIGTIYTDINYFRDKRVLIFDIGSLNVNIQEFQNLIPNYDKMATADLGINILRSKIADSLSTRYGVSISDSDVEAIFHDKHLYLNGEKVEGSNLGKSVV